MRHQHYPTAPRAPEASLLALLLVPAVLAHRPHAVVAALAARADFEGTGRAWIVYDPSDDSQLLRTDDHGAHWDQVGGAPQADVLVDMGYVGETLVVLAEDGTVWTTADEGAAWSSFELPEGTTARAMASTETRIAIATSTGVYWGAGLDAAAWTFALRGSDVAEVAWSATGEAVLLARLADGGIARSEDGGETFTLLATVGGGLGGTAIAEAGGVTWAGSDAGVVKRVDGAWEACGALPTTASTERSRWVTELVADATGTVFAATGEAAYFRSDDACLSWVAVETGLDATFGGIGGVSDPDQTYVGIVSSGRWGVVAGFDGLAITADSGATWATVAIISPDWVRGMFVAPDFPTDPRLYLGMYGGGAGWTADGGQTWEGSNAGLAGPYNFSLLPLPDFATSHTAWWAGGAPDPPAITHDGGQTWQTVDVGFDRAMSLDEVGGRLYLLGALEGESGGWLTRSADDGETWQPMTALHDVLGGVYPGIVSEPIVDGVPRLYVATDRPAGLIVSHDDGATWATVSTWGEAERSVGLEVWRATRILHAAYDTGLHVSDDLGETWTSQPAPVAHPRFLAQADDGTLFTASGDGQMYRSSDGGDSWTAVGAPLAPTISRLDILPGFAENGVAFAGTTRGVYWTRDHGDSWHRLPRFQRYAAQGFHLLCAGPCTPWDDGTGGLLDAWDLTELDVVTFQFEGHALRVDAELLGDTLFTVEVDGTAVEVDPAAEWLVSGLTEGWHDVSVRVQGGPVRLYAMEAMGDGEPFPLGGADTGDIDDDTGPVADLGHEQDPDVLVVPTNCGCQGSGGAAMFLLAVGLSTRFRRAGATSGSSPSPNRRSRRPAPPSRRHRAR
ncbi:MAG: hypothetical protein Q8P18_06120 [Pseudomonadota bacterium]|nr:hypothetical protein [Pseudomonadota bacterium]